MQPLLTIGQFAKMRPGLRMSCVDFECVIQDGEVEILVADITGKVCPPSRIAIFDSQSSILQEVGIRVRSLSLNVLMTVTCTQFTHEIMPVRTVKPVYSDYTLMRPLVQVPMLLHVCSLLLTSLMRPPLY